MQYLRTLQDGLKCQPRYCTSGSQPEGPWLLFWSQNDEPACFWAASKSRNLYPGDASADELQ